MAQHLCHTVPDIRLFPIYFVTEDILINRIKRENELSLLLKLSIISQHQLKKHVRNESETTKRRDHLKYNNGRLQSIELLGAE